MINPDFEVERLKRTLVFKGLTEDEASEIGQYASEDINTAISDLVDQALATAAEIGISMGADEFVEQLTLVPYGGFFKVSTSSGKTDFSLPPFPMLPKLLKNAETAEDGSQYKVIPIGGKSSGGKKRRLTLFDVQQDINRQQQVEREQRKREMDEARKLSFTGNARIFSGLQKAQQFMARKRGESAMQEQEAKTETSVEFRTASSKQNPSVDWVLPGKDLNMTMILEDLNMQLENNVQSTVMSIVKGYEELI